MNDHHEAEQVADSMGSVVFALLKITLVVVPVAFLLLQCSGD